MKKNQLIDSLDKLLAQGSGQDRWMAAEDIAEQLGVKSILVAEAHSSMKEISWLSTNMPGHWMEEYIAEEYVKDDPFVEGLAGGPGSMLFHCGQVRRDEAKTRKAWTLSHQLKNTGFGTLYCTRFGKDGDFGKFVTLGFEETATDKPQLDMTGKDLLAALLSTTISSESAPKAKQYRTLQKDILSTRQREVLSLLAEGMMTARIAETLGISEVAVSQHFAKARKALGANTREHALALAMSLGLISL